MCEEGGGMCLFVNLFISMDDWRKPRKGFIKRERGILLRIFHKIVKRAGFRIIKEKECIPSLTSRLRYFCKDSVYNSQVVIKLNNFFYYLFGRNITYHATNVFLKLRPTSIFYVLQKQRTNYG